jgi:hypothetical protein
MIGMPWIESTAPRSTSAARPYDAPGGWTKMRRTRRWMTVLMLPGLLAMMGATECEYFSTVRVPATDTHPPLLATRMFFFGEEELGAPIFKDTDDPDAVFVIYPAAMDGGGVRRIDVGHHLQVYCNDAPGVDFLLAPMRAEQPGGVGQWVSNGLFVYGAGITLGDYAAYCGGDAGVDEIVYTWAITAEDFAGNSSSALGGQVVYAP